MTADIHSLPSLFFIAVHVYKADEAYVSYMWKNYDVKS